MPLFVWIMQRMTERVANIPLFGRCSNFNLFYALCKRVDSVKIVSFVLCYVSVPKYVTKEIRFPSLSCVSVTMKRRRACASVEPPNGETRVGGEPIRERYEGTRGFFVSGYSSREQASPRASRIYIYIP